MTFILARFSKEPDKVMPACRTLGSDVLHGGMGAKLVNIDRDTALLLPPDRRA